MNLPFDLRARQPDIAQKPVVQRFKGMALPNPLVPLEQEIQQPVAGP